MESRRTVIIITIYLFLALASTQVLSPYIYGSIFKGEISIWFFPAFFLSGLLVFLMIRYIFKKYRKEYDQAYSVAYTPKTKYGWYGLLFTVIFIILFCTYAVLTKD